MCCSVVVRACKIHIESWVEEKGKVEEGIEEVAKKEKQWFVSFANSDFIITLEYSTYQSRATGTGATLVLEGCRMFWFSLLLGTYWLKQFITQLIHFTWFLESEMVDYRVKIESSAAARQNQG